MTSVGAGTEDDILLARFEDTSLPLESFHHCVHVQIVFLYLGKFSLLEVLAKFPPALTRYADAHGKSGLYQRDDHLGVHFADPRADAASEWDIELGGVLCAKPRLIDLEG